MKNIVLIGKNSNGKEFQYNFNGKFVSENHEEVRYELIKRDDNTFGEIIEIGDMKVVSE
jgi:hypothetical protein